MRCTSFTAAIETASGPPPSRYGASMATTLAADLGVDEGHVRVLLRLLGEQATEMPDELAAFLRQLLDPHRKRTAQVGLSWLGPNDEPQRAYGLGNDK